MHLAQSDQRRPLGLDLWIEDDQYDKRSLSHVRADLRRSGQGHTEASGKIKQDGFASLFSTLCGMGDKNENIISRR